MKKIIITTCLLASSAAMAQQWIALGGTSYNQYYLQENSLRISNNEILAMTIQNVNRINGQITYNNVGVAAAACLQKQGSVTFYTLDGKRNINSVFALGGKDAASLAATAICGTYHNYTISQPAQPVKENPPKIQMTNNPEENWHQIAVNDKSEISLKIDSFQIDKKNGEDFTLVVGRNIDKKSKKVSLVNWKVSKKDCAKQQGKLTTINIDGKDSYDNNFVIGSGSLGSIISEAICSFKP